MKKIVSILLFSVLIFSAMGCEKKENLEPARQAVSVQVGAYTNYELSKVRPIFENNNIKVEIIYDDIVADSETIISQSVNEGEILRPGDTITFHVTKQQNEDELVDMHPEDINDKKNEDDNLVPKQKDENNNQQIPAN